MTTITPSLILAFAASVIFTSAFYYAAKLYRETWSPIWFFLGLTTAFTMVLAYIHLLCAGTACFLPERGTVLYTILAPQNVDVYEAVGVLMASAFAFTSLYTVKNETSQ